MSLALLLVALGWSESGIALDSESAFVVVGGRTVCEMSQADVAAALSAMPWVTRAPEPRWLDAAERLCAFRLRC